MNNDNEFDTAKTLLMDEQAAWVTLDDLPTLKMDATGVGVVDRYELLEKLGQGGFGAVYGARDTEAGILVALKALPAEVSCDVSEMKAIRENFALVSRLHHPYIASVLHLHRVEHPDARATEKMGIQSGDYLVVMEYAQGATLSAFRSAMPEKKMTLFQALEYARPIANALDHAHEKKVLHRDVKPQNVIISRENGLDVKVLDFGLAAEIRSSMSRKSKESKDLKSGTPNYMAPEQWSGKTQDGRADQYALAATVYELVRGRVAFKSVFDTGNIEIMRSVVVSEPIEPVEDLTKGQNAVLRRAMSKEPKDRFGSCEEFVDALKKGRAESGLERVKAALVNRKAAMLLAVLIAAGFGVFKMSEQSDAQPLQPIVEKNVQESAVHEAKVDGEMAVEELEKELSDLGQGFGEKIESLKRDLRIAQTMHGSKSWDKAFDAFKGVSSACAALRAREEVRGQASDVRDQMERKRRDAEAQSAETLAKVEWKNGVGAARVATQAFENGKFEEASKGWKTAAKMFQTSEEMATAISLYRKAKGEWEGRMSNVEQGISNSEVEKYASVEWTAAERSARLGAEMENNPVRGKAHYVEALVSFKKAVENAVPRMVPKMKWIATLNGREVAATLKIGNKTFTLPETIKFQKDQSYTTSLTYSGCRTVSATLKADWNGLKEKRIALEEQKMPSDLVEVSGATTASSAQKRAVAQTSLPLEVKSRKTDIAFRLVPAGTFTMGSPDSEPGRYSYEGPQHSVTISKPFYCGKFEVTQAQWKQVMGTSPAHFKNAGANAPVESVSWDDCQTFLKKLCDLEGVPQGTYRLLTEAQWEYACRAGTKTALYNGRLTLAGTCNGPELDSIAWYGGNSGVSYEGGYDSSGWSEKQYNHTKAGTHPVGRKNANAWGMYDMIGNVYEWCSDWYGDYPAGSVTDPTGVASGSIRVSRGGSWRSFARSCRSANRLRYTPGYRLDSVGFRLLRTAPNLP